MRTWRELVILLAILVCWTYAGYLTGQHDGARSHTPALYSETRHALRYAEWCGGVVEITPLFGGGHDVVVKGCDQ